MHQRQLIREAVVARLLNRTAAGPRVSKMQATPHRATKLPALAVYILSDTVDDTNSTAPREFKRNVDLHIQGLVELTVNVDDALDDLALQVETLMGADDTLDSTVADCRLSQVEIEILPDGERPVGYVDLQYAVTYYTSVGIEATDPFRTGGVQHDASGATAHDIIPIPE